MTSFLVLSSFGMDEEGERIGCVSTERGQTRTLQIEVKRAWKPFRSMEYFAVSHFPTDGGKFGRTG